MIPQLVRLSRRSALHQPSWLHTPRKLLKFEIKLHVINEMVKNRQRIFSSTTCSPSQCCETIPLNGQLKLHKIFHNFSKHAGCYFTTSSLIELSSLKGCLNIFVFWKLNHYFLLTYMYFSRPNSSVLKSFLLPLAECFRIFRFPVNPRAEVLKRTFWNWPRKANKQCCRKVWKNLWKFDTCFLEVG